MRRVSVLSSQLTTSTYLTPVPTEGEAAPFPEGKIFPMLIAGELVQAEGNKADDVINPATGHPFTKVPSASQADLQRAVASAKEAFKTWKNTSFEERAKCLKAFADALEKRGDEFARAVTLEQGKPLRMAKGEMLGVVGSARKLAKEDLLKPEKRAEDKRYTYELHYAPRGVVGGIMPWNFPLSTAGSKILPAVVTGNCVIVKPSPYTPLATVMLSEICRDCFPPGVVNIVTGGNDLGQSMVDHPDIPHITFTGSAATGKKIMASSAAKLKHLTLELGGNDPAIVLPDADLSKAAPKILEAAMFNTGQICIAAKRIFVHESKYEEMVGLLKDEADKQIKFGDGMDPKASHGPINNKMQLERVEMLVEDAKRAGARVVTGGKRFAPTGQPDGYFYEPTIIADIKEGTRLVDEEQFGPVIPVIKYSNVEDAIKSANSTEYGLGGSVWTSDPRGKGAEVAKQIDSGMVWINTHIMAGPQFGAMPFGGVKGSGMGREGGEHNGDAIGLKEYVEMKSVSIPKE